MPEGAGVQAVAALTGLPAHCIISSACSSEASCACQGGAGLPEGAPARGQAVAAMAKMPTYLIFMSAL